MKKNVLEFSIEREGCVKPMFCIPGSPGCISYCVSSIIFNQFIHILFLKEYLRQGCLILFQGCIFFIICYECMVCILECVSVPKDH